MRLRMVTITGANDTTAPEALGALSTEFPWVEWGLLASKSGWKEFRRLSVTAGWIEHLERVASPGMRFSAHVCGRWARQICAGAFPSEIDRPLFTRAQLNVSLWVGSIRNPAVMASCLPPGREYVIQVGSELEAGLALARRLRDAHGLAASVLFDASGGRGLLPASWPNRPAGIPCGFAGGLGPETLSEQLAKLEDITGDASIWVDMQAHVRSDDGRVLDLTKVRRCLEIAAAYVE